MQANLKISLRITAGALAVATSLFAGGVLAAPSYMAVLPVGKADGAKPFVLNVTLNENTFDYIMKDAAVAAGWDGERPLKMTVTIPSGIVVGSSSTATAGFKTGTEFPVGSSLSLRNRGYIVGRGGAGGQNFSWDLPGGAGGPGGPALQAEYALILENEGIIGGGGGGGGGSNQYAPTGGFGIGAGGAGGGAGALGGEPGIGGMTTSVGGAYATKGTQGMLATGGVSGKPGTYGGYIGNQAGRGGDLAQPGAAGRTQRQYNGVTYPGGAGGTPGEAVIGDSFITWKERGEVLGLLR